MGDLLLDLSDSWLLDLGTFSDDEVADGEELDDELDEEDELEETRLAFLRLCLFLRFERDLVLDLDLLEGSDDE